MKLSATQRELAADQREQIARLRERIVPDREMPVGPGDVALRHEIAVGEQHRRVVFVGLDARRVDRHHVRPVEEIGDAAEAFGLALRAVDVAGAVKPHELGVAGRIDHGLDLEFERPVRRLRDGEPVRRRRRSSRPAAACRRALSDDELQLVAIEHQRRRRAGGVGFELQLGAHPWRVGCSERRDRRSRSASRAGGNPAGGRRGVLRCA